MSVCVTHVGPGLAALISTEALCANVLQVPGVTPTPTAAASTSARTTRAASTPGASMTGPHSGVNVPRASREIQLSSA